MVNLQEVFSYRPLVLRALLLNIKLACSFAPSKAVFRVGYLRLTTAVSITYSLDRSGVYVGESLLQIQEGFLQDRVRHRGKEHRKSQG
jgi:hypothetical protein